MISTSSGSCYRSDSLWPFDVSVYPDLIHSSRAFVVVCCYACRPGVFPKIRNASARGFPAVVWMPWRWKNGATGLMKKVCISNLRWELWSWRFATRIIICPNIEEHSSYSICICRAVGIYEKLMEIAPSRDNVLTPWSIILVVHGVLGVIKISFPSIFWGTNHRITSTG